MRKYCLILLIMLIAAVSVWPAKQKNQPRRTLDIYYVDVEGGAATLIVTPARESILVDAGWPGFEGRDARRIQQAMQVAGINAIDHLIATHYHTDHYGGIPELAKLIPVKHFYDHGPMSSLAEDKNFPQMYAAYRQAAKNQTRTLKPGDTIRLRRAPGTPPIKLLCIAAHGEVIGNGQKRSNPECSSAVPKPEDTSDNARSVAFILSYGGFDFLDCGDLTWNVEHRLVCPTNRIGEVDLYQVTHHGMNTSNNPVLLRSVRPTVAIMNNGPRKGGHPDTVKWLQELPSLKALYQVHRNIATEAAQNTPEKFIANIEAQPDAAHMITVSVDARSRTFTVTNHRTKATESYPIK